MNRRRRLATCLLASLILAVLAPLPLGYAGPFDSVKKKAEKKAQEAAKKAAGAAPETAVPDSTLPDAAAPGEAASGGGSEKVSAVSTKFDFVPGDKVMFMDDFTQDELGEFPAQWTLVLGTFEVAEREGEHWLRCISPDGRVRMKLPAMTALPEFWTLEFDFFGEEPLNSTLSVIALGAGGRGAWEAVYPHGSNMAFRTGEIFSTTPLEGAPNPGGRHHVMFMARGTGLKAYMDRQRLVNVPDITVPAGPPLELEIRLWANTKPMITNVRFAEGCRPPKDMLAEGKLVTYGIRFASGSDVVLPDSAPVLRQVAAYMQANAAVKLRITGHTDNVGSPASNLDLSTRRAASVAKVLSDQFGIAADRFATDGKGDTEALADNAKAEGRAMNRRVEFSKL